jgi:hypothetical protein
MLVFVQSNKGNPLMPCSWRKARLLLKYGKATIVRHPALKGEAWFSPSCYLIYPKDRGGFHRDVEVFR